ncbi:hypothetical protein HED60_13870 [Planctomycetales bacterium ZRK34]|nr:hypothetical protein HED60_13870 [Planctomycetales bacterium ZRK34]
MIHIAIATDQRYWGYLPGLLCSIMINSTEYVKAHILVRDVPQAKQWADIFSTEALQVDIIDCGSFLADVKLYLASNTTRSTMDRLLLPSALPGVDRVIYLDIDTLVLSDLKELYSQDTGPVGLKAKRSKNPHVATIGNSLRAWGHDNCEQILDHIDGKWPSFNAGVMLMDLECLRQCDFTAKTMRYVHEFGVNDQHACAIYAEGRCAPLAPSWNVFIGSDHDRTTPWHILHWAGSVKPWTPTAALHEMWLSYQPNHGVSCQNSRMPRVIETLDSMK